MIKVATVVVCVIGIIGLFLLARGAQTYLQWPTMQGADAVGAIVGGSFVFLLGLWMLGGAIWAALKIWESGVR